MNPKHIIKKQILDLTLDSQVGSFSFQSRVGSFYKREILPLIDEYCNAVAGGDAVIRIDRLEVDLGRIVKPDFERQFKHKFAQIMPEKLTEAIQMSVNRDFCAAEAGRPDLNTAADRDFAVLEFFIHEGSLPWWVSGDELYEMPVLLQHTLAARPDKVKRLLAAIADNAAELKRLIYHADDATLGQIITLFQPEHGPAIYRLAQALLGGLTVCPLLQSGGTAKLRPEVWGNILSSSIAAEGQAFNRQLAIADTLKRIAKISGVDAEALSNRLVIEKDDSFNALPAQPPAYFNGEYRRQLEKLTQLYETLPLVLTEEVLPQLIADFEQRLDAAVDQKPVKAERKIVRKISKALAALLKQFNQRKESNAPLAIVKCAEQFKILEKLLVQLSAGAAFPEAGNLARLFQTLQNSAGLLNRLLDADENKGAPVPAWDEEFLKAKDRLETLLDKLRDDLAVVTEQNSGARQSKLLQDIGNSIGAFEYLSANFAAPHGTGHRDPFSASEELYVSNAGLILLWPYLSRFFGILDLAGGGRFVDDAAAERAVLLLQYLAAGTDRKFREYELILNKILCGIDTNAPLKPYLEITEAERTECETLLQAVLLNWPTLKNLSVPGLRSLFLHREGLIFTRDGQRVLRVAGTAYDILVRRIPWGIGTVKLPWMEQLLMVEWGYESGDGPLTQNKE
jgi:hypothetical protein